MAAITNAGWFFRSRRCRRRIKNQNAAKVAINIMTIGTTTAGMIVLRFDEDLLFFETLDDAEAAWLETEVVVFVAVDAAARREL